MEEEGALSVPPYLEVRLHDLMDGLAWPRSFFHTASTPRSQQNLVAFFLLLLLFVLFGLEAGLRGWGEEGGGGESSANGF